MKSALVVVLLAVFVCPQLLAQDSYTINPGDRIAIEVWNEPDLQREVTILPDGTLSFPLVGLINAAGLSLQELQNSVANKLGGFITNPVVTVSITEMAGNTIFVIGQVNTPGAFVMTSPMTALQALSLSGGFTTFAETRRIKIIRNTENGQEVLRVNYSDLASGDKLETNHQLISGDVLVVP